MWFKLLSEGKVMESDKKKYLTPVLAIIIVMMAFVVIPLIVAETSQKHVRKTESMSILSSWPGTMPRWQAAGMI